MHVENFLFQNCSILSVLSIFIIFITEEKQIINSLLLDKCYPVISHRRVRKESDELLIWSLVMVRSQLPAQVVKSTTSPVITRRINGAASLLSARIHGDRDDRREISGSEFNGNRAIRGKAFLLVSERLFQTQPATQEPGVLDWRTWMERFLREGSASRFGIQWRFFHGHRGPRRPIWITKSPGRRITAPRRRCDTVRASLSFVARFAFQAKPSFADFHPCWSRPDPRRGIDASKNMHAALIRRMMPFFER